MKTYKLKDYHRGWFVGDFDNTIIRTPSHELAVKYYVKGDFEDSHRHLLSDEINVVVFGSVSMNGVIYSEGDVIVQEKGEYTDFLCVSDRAIMTVYRTDGSYPNDKYFLKD